MTSSPWSAMDQYDPQLHDDDDDYTRGPGCWPLIVMCVLAWLILAWLGYVAWLLFGQ